MKTKNILKRALVSTILSLTCMISLTVLYGSSVTIRDYNTWKVVYRSVSTQKAEETLKQMNNVEPKKYILVQEWNGRTLVPWM